MPEDSLTTRLEYPDPRLIQALDELTRWLPPDPRSETGTVVVRANSGDREAFEALVRCVETTLSQSPEWHLLQAIAGYVARLRELLDAPPAHIEIDVRFGYEVQVLIRWAHIQEGGRRECWSVPPKHHDLWHELSSRPEKDRAEAIRSLASSSDPRYLESIWNLIEAVRRGRGADDPVSWAFLKEYPEDRVHQVAVEVATDIFVRTCRELPWTHMQLADVIHSLLCSDSSDRRGPSYRLRGLIAEHVAASHRAEQTRWPLLRVMQFCVGNVDQHHQVILLRHQDVGMDRGPSPLPFSNPSVLVPPPALFGGDAARRRAKKAIESWFAKARALLGATDLDAVFVLPLRDGPRQRIASTAWTSDDRSGVEHQVALNVAFQASALGLSKRPRRVQTADRILLGDGQVFVDSLPYRLDGDGARDFVAKLTAKRGGLLKASDLQKAIGQRPDKLFRKLPKPLQDLIDRPGKGREGYRLK